MQKPISYLSCLFLFKVAVGAILLLVGWDSIGLSGNGVENIVIAMGLSFLPAAFAKPLFNKFRFIATQKIITIALILSSILVLLDHLLMKNNLILFFLCHFILWICIFMVEVGCEKWYVAIAQNHTLKKVRGISGISTGVGQLGIIFGPLMVMYSKLYNDSLAYYCIALVFFIAALFPLNNVINAIASNGNKPVAVNLEKFNYKSWLYTFAFAMIWPTLTIFNISVPLLAKTNSYNSINVAGILEMIIALATAIAGFSHVYITNYGSFKTRTVFIFIALVTACGLAYFFNNNFPLLILGIFILGFSFGYLRVELRTYLSKSFSTEVAGGIIATANSWSGPLVIIYALIFYFESSLHPLNHINLIFPFSFIICAAMFIYLLTADQQIGEMTQ